MTDEEWIEKSVAVDSAQKSAVIERRLYTKTILEIDSRHAAGGTFESSMRVQACVKAVGDAIAEMIEVHLEAERVAHLRCGAAEVSDARLRQLRAKLERLRGPHREEMLDRAIKGRDRYRAFYDVAVEKVGQQLAEAAEYGVQRVQLDVQKPPVSAWAGGDTYIQNVSAPNFGVLAQRIGHIGTGAHGVGEALGELLEITRLLERAQAVGAQQLVEGLVLEVEHAERGEAVNRVGAAAVLEKLKRSLEVVSNVERVATLVARVAGWLDSLGG